MAIKEIPLNALKGCAGAVAVFTIPVVLFLMFAWVIL